MLQLFRKMLIWSKPNKTKKLIKDSHEFNGVLAHKLIDRKTFVDLAFHRHYHRDVPDLEQKWNLPKLKLTLQLHTIYDNLSTAEVLLTSTKIMFIKLDGDGEWADTHGKFDTKNEYQFNELLTHHLVDFHFNRILNKDGNFSGEIELSKRFDNILFLDNFMNSKLQNLITNFELGAGIIIDEPWFEGSGKDENFNNLLKNQVQTIFDNFKKFGYKAVIEYSNLPNTLIVRCIPEIWSDKIDENIVIECDLSVFFEESKVTVFQNPNYFVHKIYSVILEQLLSEHYKKTYHKGLIFIVGSLNFSIRNVTIDYNESEPMDSHYKVVVESPVDDSHYIGGIEKPTSMEPRIGSIALDLIPTIPLGTESMVIKLTDGDGTVDESLMKMKSPEIDLSEFKHEPIFVPLDLVNPGIIINDSIAEKIIVDSKFQLKDIDMVQTKATGNYMENWAEKIKQSQEAKSMREGDEPYIIGIDMGVLSTEFNEDELSVAFIADSIEPIKISDEMKERLTSIEHFDNVFENIKKNSGIPPRYFDDNENKSKSAFESKSIELKPDAPTERIKTDVNFNNEDKE